MKKKRDKRSEEEQFNEILFYFMLGLAVMIVTLLTLEKYGIV